MTQVMYVTEVLETLIDLGLSMHRLGGYPSFSSDAQKKAAEAINKAILATGEWSDSLSDRDCELEIPELSKNELLLNYIRKLTIRHL